MEEINRRGFLASIVPALAVSPLLPLAARKEERLDEGTLTCRWVEGPLPGDGNHWLVVGRQVSLDHFNHRVSSAELVLWRNGNGNWQCRSGHNHRSFEAPDLETAKRIAEQQFVEWLKAMLVEAERFAFRLKR